MEYYRLGRIWTIVLAVPDFENDCSRHCIPGVCLQIMKPRPKTRAPVDDEKYVNESLVVYVVFLALSGFALTVPPMYGISFSQNAIDHIGWVVHRRGFISYTWSCMYTANTKILNFVLI